MVALCEPSWTNHRSHGCPRPQVFSDWGCSTQSSVNNSSGTIKQEIVHHNTFSR